MKLKVKKVRNNAKIPVVAHKGDLGIDVFYAGQNTVSLAAGEQKKLETGWIMEYEPLWLVKSAAHGLAIGTCVPEPIGFNIGLIAKQSSGVAFKKYLDVKAGVIDATYRGEIEILLYNYGKQPQFILPGEKIAQLVPILCLTGAVEVVEKLSETDRGTAGWGSGHIVSASLTPAGTHTVDLKGHIEDLSTDLTAGETIHNDSKPKQLNLFDENSTTDN